MGVSNSYTVRKFDILHAIVRAYISDGEPVASRDIARSRRDGLSAASIRNVMADLCDEGYLAQPHTSAGRIPTEKAFRSYIESLTNTNRVLGAELDRVRSELRTAGTMDARVERSSHMLTEMSSGMGIAAAFPTASQVLDQIELMPLADHRLLMIVVTRDRVVRNRVVSLDDDVSESELESIRNYVNRNFSGWGFSDIQQELSARLEKDSAAYDAILRTLTELYSKGLLDIGQSPEVHMEGVSNLIGIDMHLTREKMQELFRALEEKKRILRMLDRFLEGREGELAVQVGLSEAHPSMSELSLIGLSVRLPGGTYARVAVLGPMRMNYSRVMSAVLHVGQALQSTP